MTSSSSEATSYVPFEIQEQIIKRLPVKSLVRFRSVSKQWKSLIESSDFIIDHQTQQQKQPRRNHLLIKYRCVEDWDDKYISIVNDASLPRHHSHLAAAAVPPLIDLVCDPSLLDCSSHGLVCVHGYHYKRANKTLIVVWNPSIRKSVGVTVPSAGLVAVRFGVCPNTNEPKILRIIEQDHTLDFKTEVFALSTGTWRSLPPLCLPFELALFDPNQVVIDGVIYWVARNRIGMYVESIIISFDLTSEVFHQLVLPEDLMLACHGKRKSIAKLHDDSLALILTNLDRCLCEVWTTKGSPSKSSSSSSSSSSCTWFTKLFEIDSRETIQLLHYFNMLGFNMNGHMMLGGCRLRVYEPSSKHMKRLEIDAADDDDEGMKMAYYTESLFLLNHSSSIII
ncbi:hypothetical protein SSX86_012334 [Deinandra increscens subsp. villosa]|uniref:F-box domain-containing protein n=1 Tax=Deinandra increscens subsp. villosa TaxID=3103831 RepID=A0AAP0D870_9ASTR